MSEYSPKATGFEHGARQLEASLDEFVNPLLEQMDRQLDKRLVRTFHRSLKVLLAYGNQVQGLLLSELGAYLISPDKAPAGTKRLSNLLRSDKWSSDLIDDYLWRDACARQQQISGDTLLLWDSSVVEKPESRKLEALCPVRSAKAKRLQRTRPGFGGGPPGRPTFVPGYHWLALLLCGRSGPVTLSAMRWFSTRSERATTEREVMRPLLDQALATWQRQAIHIFDRGFAGGPWVSHLCGRDARFILRWPKRYKLSPVGDGGEALEKRATWQITRGKRSWQQRLVREGHSGRVYEAGVVAAPVRHPDLPDRELWLVVSRPRAGREPWYLLTNEPVTDADSAWAVVFAYARRWQIETAFRFNKSELSLESPRLWTLERRIKFLQMLSLAYGFMLWLLQEPMQALREWLLVAYCPRTGKRSRESSAPLYRLRWAIARVLSFYLMAGMINKLNSG